MLDLEKIDVNSLENILEKVQKIHRFFKTLREIAEENKKTHTPSFLSKEETAMILGITPSHLAVLRHRGKGPKFLKVGHCIYYDVADVLDYINSCRYLSTTEKVASLEGGHHE